MLSLCHPGLDLLDLESQLTLMAFLLTAHVERRKEVLQTRTVVDHKCAGEWNLGGATVRDHRMTAPCAHALGSGLRLLERASARKRAQNVATQGFRCLCGLIFLFNFFVDAWNCLLYTSPSPRDS